MNKTDRILDQWKDDNILLKNNYIAIYTSIFWVHICAKYLFNQSHKLELLFPCMDEETEAQK